MGNARKITKRELANKRSRVMDRLQNDAAHSAAGAKMRSRMFELVGKAENTNGQFNLLCLASTAVDRVEQDEDRITGAQVRAGGRMGANKVNGNSQERHRLWQSEANKYFARHPNASKREAAHHISKITGVPPNTIRQVIQKPKQKS